MHCQLLLLRCGHRGGGRFTTSTEKHCSIQAGPWREGRCWTAKIVRNEHQRDGEEKARERAAHISALKVILDYRISLRARRKRARLSARGSPVGLLSCAPPLYFEAIYKSTSPGLMQTVLLHSTSFFQDLSRFPRRTHCLLQRPPPTHHMTARVQITPPAPSGFAALQCTRTKKHSRRRAQILHRIVDTHSCQEAPSLTRAPHLPTLSSRAFTLPACRLLRHV